MQVLLQYMEEIVDRFVAHILPFKIFKLVFTLSVKNPSAKNFVGGKYSSPRQKFVIFYQRSFLPGYI